MTPGHARPCDYRHSVEVQCSSFERVDFSRVPLGEDNFASRKELPGPRWSNIEDMDFFLFINVLKFNAYDENSKCHRVSIFM